MSVQWSPFLSAEQERSFSKGQSICGHYCILCLLSAVYGIEISLFLVSALSRDSFAFLAKCKDQSF